MKNVTNKSKNLFLLFGSFFLCVSLLIAGANRTDPNRIQGFEPSYSITMNSSNAPTSETFYTSAEKTIRYSTFEYIGARASVGSHVELNSTGYLGNKANSQITSITSIQANFITSGTLTLATSFDGINYTQTTITSGAINQISTLPYHFRLTANSAIVTIQSVTITYSCAPHTTQIGQQSEYNITVKDFKAKDTSSDLSTLISADVNTYFSSDITLSSVVGSKIFANATTATNFKMGSGSAGGTITFNFPSLKISQVIVNAYKYSGDNNTKIKVITSADSTGSSLPITASTATNYTYSLLDTTNSTSLTLTGESGRFHLESLKIISAGSTASPIETGFYASDSKAATYKVNEVYSTTNGITASVALTSGSSIPVNYNADGISGYKYVVKNASNAIIDATKVFPSTGTYFVVISYKSYAPIIITLTVSAAPQVTLTSVSAVDAKTTYKLGDIYDNLNKLVVTATYSDSSTATISYDPTGVNGYTIYCLDPNANDFYTSNPFSLAGDYLLTVTYKGIESNDVDITVTSETGPVTQATINVLTNTLSDSTAVTSPKDYLSATGVTISNATATNVYGGAGAAKFRFSSSKSTGSLTINFSSGVVISSVSLNVEQYGSDNPISIKVATSINPNGENQTLSTPSGMLTYTGFASDTQPSNSITISSAANNRFYLSSVSLGIGSSAPVNLTGVSMKSATTLATGGTEVLVPTILPSNANPVPDLSWSTDNASIATVSNGTITGVGVGTTTIRVTAIQGALSFSSACTVTVTAATNYSVKSMNYDYQDYMDNNYYSNVDSSPSKGNVNFLVIPVELAGYPMSEATRTRIQKAYFGTEAETGWHSVASFYKQESNGRLNITGTVAPIYKTTYGASITEAQTTSLVSTATNWYKTTYSSNNGKEFDADSDGFIDGVILIYSAPNGTSNNDNLWAYCFWTNNSSSLTSPTASTFFWASYDFMDESANATIDAHTYIHEAGHVFGLDDYYNYDSASKYGAAGGFNMQDYNVGEHDPYSRVALGWIDPIVPTGNTTLTIAPGEAIILSPNDLSSSSPFDEYLILDVYSPTGLNEFDSTYKYGGSNSMYPKGPNVTGIRVWHVDARLMRNYTGSTPTLTSTIISGNSYMHATSNSTNSTYGSLSSLYRSYKLLHLLQRGGTNTYMNGGQFSSTDVWGVGHSFSMSTYASFFVNSGKLNSGTSLPYSFSVTAINGTSVTLSITKN
jgi:M6 family metalloprotease-like protein